MSHPSLSPVTALPLEHQFPLVAPGRVPETRLRFAFLDGLRGLAALYVALYHGYAWVCSAPLAARSQQERFFVALLSPLAWGPYSVVVFVVLSGFCLMLPVARRPHEAANDASPMGMLPGGFKEYLRRRALRILPSYGGALLLSFFVLLACKMWRRNWGLAPGLEGDPRTNFDARNWIAHGLLLHNLNPAWARSLNNSLWSVATEWQIYFAFPALLWVWKRVGSMATIAAGCSVGWFLTAVARGQFDLASPWFLGVFAIGMAGAAIVCSGPNARRMPWLWVSGLMTLALLGASGFSACGLMGVAWLADVVFGLACAALLIGCANAQLDGSRRPLFLQRVLESRPALWLGACSYSLYLTHYLWLFLLDAFAARSNWSLTTRLLAAVGIYCPVAIGVAWVFHLGFERSFLARRARAANQLATAPAAAS